MRTAEVGCATRFLCGHVERDIGHQLLDLNIKAGLHFPSSGRCHAQGTAVEVLAHPSLFKRHFEQGGAECSAQVWAALAPVETGAGKASAQLARGVEINSHATQSFFSLHGQFVVVVARTRSIAA